MNVALWIGQVLLAMHTALGAVWKLSTPETKVDSLAALPHAVWLGMSGLELVLAVMLLAPAANKSLGVLAPIAAVGVALEMLAMSGVHLASGVTNHGQMIYWLVVAVLCAGLAYGRFVLRPIGSASQPGTAAA
jgi:hypothetical protein